MSYMTKAVLSTTLLCTSTLNNIGVSHGFIGVPVLTTPFSGPLSIRDDKSPSFVTNTIPSYLTTYPNRHHDCATRRNLINPAIDSALAGSIAGAIGVGTAFPLDTLKTKSQVLGGSQGISTNSSIGVAGATATSADMNQLNMFQLISLIYKMEGISGFFGGVRLMMIGQAIIKSVAFSVNAAALDYLHTDFKAMDPLLALIVAAAFSGFATSFLVAPFERVKVMMQASDKGKYSNELHCIETVIQSEGIGGLFSRGLGATLAREIPSYAIYFFVYEVLMSYPIAESLGQVAPLIFGATAGCACWVPVYPIDVVKTLQQNTEGGGEHVGALVIAKRLYEQGGIAAFFDGLTPKMLRAAVNHAVTFYVYALLISHM